MAVQRLSKVARELNVGISTIVDFLETKGVSIDAKPNTKLEANVYDIVSAEFQSDKGAKEESKNVSMPSTDRESVSIESTTAEVETTPAPEAEVESILIKNIPADDVVEKVEVEEPAIVEEVVEEKPSTGVEITPVESTDEDGKVKVLGTIDLSAMNLKTRPDKKSKKEQEKAEKAEKASKAEQEKVAKAAKKAAAEKKKVDAAAAAKVAAETAAVEAEKKRLAAIEAAKPQEIKTAVGK
jgi:translation initiation factor IF-2